jgi:hypothetical protein
MGPVGQAADPSLSTWANFYVIAGSAAAALIGVQFVVIALIANLRKVATDESVGAFGTPTVVHMASTLILSGLMTAPWPSLFPVSMALALCGLGGLAYTATVTHRARRQDTYTPVLEDWVWHFIVPGGVYAAVAVAALLMHGRPRAALFLVGGATIGLLLVGIHNAWDTVTFVVAGGIPADPDRKP